VRQGLGVASFAALLFFLTGGNPLPDLRARLSVLRGSVGENLRARRLAGSAAAYDRRFFEGILAARDALPPGSKGVAVYAPAVPEWGGLYLAVYHFAPVPVLIAPSRVPAGWLAICYGQDPRPGWRVVRPLPGGALLMPSP